MKVVKDVEEHQPVEAGVPATPDFLELLVRGRTTPPAAGSWFAVGEVVGLSDDGRTPLVVYPGTTTSSAVPARSTFDLHAAHIGKAVVLLFENADPARPVVVGVLRDGGESALEKTAGHVDVDVDGQRLLVTAKEQLVLRCGAASITLTKAGKVLIEGTYVSTRSSGVNRMRGGSIELN